MSRASFRARDMAVTLLRKRSGEPFTSPGFTRLMQHAARHQKAGGWVSVRRRPLEEAITVDGFQCIELADVELFEPLA